MKSFWHKWRNLEAILNFIYFIPLFRPYLLQFLRALSLVSYNLIGTWFATQRGFVGSCFYYAFHLWWVHLSSFSMRMSVL